MSAVASLNAATQATNIHIRRLLQRNSPNSSTDLSSTPGGTVYSTTPGGTRIVYDRTFLLQCRNSPLSRCSPVLPQIPGVTCLPSSITNKLSKSPPATEHQQQVFTTPTTTDELVTLGQSRTNSENSEDGGLTFHLDM